MTYDNNISRQFFTGTLRPQRRFRQSTPVLDRTLVIGEKGKLFSRVRLWIYEPTIDYPKYSIFLQIKNASGSAYSDIELSDLQNLLLNIQQWIAEVQAIQPALDVKQQQAQAYRDNYDRYQQLAEQFNANQQFTPDSTPDTYDPGEYSQRPRDGKGRFVRREDYE